MENRFSLCYSGGLVGGLNLGWTETLGLPIDEVEFLLERLDEMRSRSK